MAQAVGCDEATHRPERQATIDNRPGFCFPPRQFPFEVLLRQVTGFVEPGFTIEVLPLPQGATFFLCQERISEEPGKSLPKKVFESRA